MEYEPIIDAESSINHSTAELKRLDTAIARARYECENSASLLAIQNSDHCDEELARSYAENARLRDRLAELCAEAEGMAKALNHATRASEFDALTQLPNRLLLTDRFARSLAIARRQRIPLALMFLDVDGFKECNDRLGHAAGDQVLVQLGARLRACVREVDTVSRLGGDEFVVLMVGTFQLEDLAQIAGKILTAARSIDRIGQQEVRITISLGISMFPEHGSDLEVLKSAADAAMYRVKRGGGNNFSFASEPLPVKESAGTRHSDGLMP